MAIRITLRMTFKTGYFQGISKGDLKWELDKETEAAVPSCPSLHRSPTVGPSCNDFVYPECWHFDNGAISNFDDVPLEHGKQRSIKY